MSSLQPGVEEPTKSSALSNGNGPGKDSAEIRGGFVLKSRSDEAPVRRRSLVERTGMKNLIQVRQEAGDRRQEAGDRRQEAGGCCVRSVRGLFSLARLCIYLCKIQSVL